LFYSFSVDGAILHGHEVVAISPYPARRSAVLSMKPAKDVPAKLRVQTHIAVRGYASHLHVLEKTVDIPRYNINYKNIRRYCFLVKFRKILIFIYL
jgi:hypothetical protein